VPASGRLAAFAADLQPDLTESQHPAHSRPADGRTTRPAVLSAYKQPRFSLHLSQNVPYLFSCMAEIKSGGVQ